MKKSAVKITLACTKYMMIRMIVCYILLVLVVAVDFTKSNKYYRYYRSDLPEPESAEITVTIADDGRALIEESLMYPDGGAPVKTSGKTYSAVKTLRDGSLTFVYNYSPYTAVGSVNVKIALENADMSKAVQWSSAKGFHGAAGTRKGAYVAFTTGGLERSEYIEIKLLLSREYFGELSDKIKPYYEQGDLLYSTERWEFTLEYGSKASSLTMHYIRLADRVVMFALLILLVLLFVLPFTHKEPDQLPADDDAPGKLKYIKGMRSYVLRILWCELALAACVALNPFEFRLKWFVISVFVTIGIGMTLVMGALIALSIMKQAKVETKSPRSKDGNVPDITALGKLPVKSAGRQILIEINTVTGRGGSRTVYIAKCCEEYYSLYKCPRCGRINLQKIKSVIKASGDTERKAAQTLTKYVPSVSEALMSGTECRLSTCLKANLVTECIECEKIPYWAVKYDNKDTEVTFFATWFILAAAAVVVAGALGLRDAEPFLVLAASMCLPALPLIKPLILLKHAVKKRLSRYPSPRLMAGSIAELDARKTETDAFRELKLKPKIEDYGNKWAKGHGGSSGTIIGN